MEETAENKRPIVLTIICVLIIIGAILAPLSIYAVMNNPVAMDVMEKASQLSISIQYAMTEHERMSKICHDSTWLDRWIGNSCRHA